MDFHLRDATDSVVHWVDFGEFDVDSGDISGGACPTNQTVLRAVCESAKTPPTINECHAHL